MVLKRLPFSKRAAGISLGVLVAAGAAGGAGWYWMTHARFIEATNNAYLKADPSMIAPDVRGHVAAVLVAENQRVKEGAPLVRIERERFEAAVAAAESRLDATRAELATIERQIDVQSAVVTRAEAAVERAEAERDRAAKDRKRYRDLAEGRAGSRERYETALADDRKAVSALKAAEAAVRVEERRLAMLRSRLDETRAGIETVKAELKRARIDLEDTVVRAPYAGVIGDKEVERGQYVRPGQELFTLVDAQDTYVQANFKETQLAHMAVGQTARLEVDAFPDTPIAGRIASFAPATGAEFALLPPRNATGNFTKVTQRVPVRIELPDDHALEGALRPGLSVVVEVDTTTAGARPHAGEGLARAARPAGQGEPAPVRTPDLGDD